MKKLALWTEWPFTLPNPHGPGDDCFTTLSRNLLTVGWELCSYAECLRSQQRPDAVLCLNLPRKSLAHLLGNWLDKVPAYAFLMESEVILPHNWDIDRHKDYKAIFTWRSDLADGHRYVWLNFSQSLQPRFYPDSIQKSKLCTLIAGNKCSYHPLELYSKRVAAIRWFEQHHPQDFDLYGAGWDKPLFKYPPHLKWLKRIKPLTRLLARSYPSYRGAISDKIGVLKNYRFSICYENARNIHDYITEKIFDCLVAGCMPIYWGAPNINTHIPDECFIDARAFPDIYAIYEYMTAMPEDIYQKHLYAIHRFLTSDQAKPYSSEYFAETLVRTITNTDQASC